MYVGIATIGKETIEIRAKHLYTLRVLSSATWISVFVDDEMIGQFDPRGNWFDLRPEDRQSPDDPPSVPRHESGEFWQLADVSLSGG